MEIRDKKIENLMLNLGRKLEIRKLDAKFR